MTNRSRAVLYTGVTRSVQRPLWCHGNASSRSFTKRYKVDRLVYYESFGPARDAISREKEIKGWCREEKNDLVQTLNPKWKIWERSYSAIVAWSLAPLGMTMKVD